MRAQLLDEADTIVADACGGHGRRSPIRRPKRAMGGASKLQTAVRIGADETAPLREFYLARDAAVHREADAGAPARGEVARRAGVRTAAHAAAPACFHSALADLENICEEQRQLRRQQRMHAVLHGWLLTHIPLSFALMVLAIVHIVTALRY